MITHEFEYDPAKSRSNLEKHGIDFKSAEVLWRDRRRIHVEINYTGERRHGVLGTAKGKIWFAVYTMRENRIRLISVRRARMKEKIIYEEKG